MWCASGALLRIGCNRTVTSPMHKPAAVCAAIGYRSHSSGLTRRHMTHSVAHTNNGTKPPIASQRDLPCFAKCPNTDVALPTPNCTSAVACLVLPLPPHVLEDDGDEHRDHKTKECHLGDSEVRQVLGPRELAQAPSALVRLQPELRPYSPHKVNASTRVFRCQSSRVPNQ